MIIKSYGDMAQHMFLRSRNAELKQNIETLSGELASGKVANITSRLGGDFTYLSDIETTLARLESHMIATGEAKLFATGVQGSLERLQSNVIDMRDDVLALTSTMTATDAEQFAARGRIELDNAINTLNSWSGGRSLFSGTATSTSPLNDGDSLMTDLVAEVGGLTTSADIIQAVKDWFADPAGFDTVMYRGSTTDLSPVEVSDGERVSIGLRADDPDLKHSLQSFAIAALVGESALGLTNEVKVELARAVGMELANSNESLVSKQADMGFIEGQLERVEARNTATETSLSIAKNKLVSADPYEVHTRLEEAQLQLESLYSVTARSAQLSLLRYMS